MKIFTLQEANEMLPLVRPRLEQLRKLVKKVAAMRPRAESAASASGSGGGMHGGSTYVRCILDIGKIIDELSNDGIQIKDHERGLIDFPCLRDGRLILLCWQLGERDVIEWWHETEAGFAGRQRL